MSNLIQQGQRRLRGVGASEGIAIGKAFVLERERISIPHRTIAENEVADEVERFRDALERAKRGLSEIKEAMSQAESREPAFIIDAHIMMLEDKLLVEGSIEQIEQNRINAEWALRRKVSELVAVFSRMKDPYLRERGRDVEEVAERVVRELVGKTETQLDELDEPALVVAHEITPTETAHMAIDKVMGFATDIGSSTSHAAIVAKSLRIPAVVGLKTVTAEIAHGDTVLIDGHAGVVIINPSPETLEEYESRRRWIEEFRQALKRYRPLPSETEDGHKIILAANLEITEELQFFEESGAEGVGLYRTEFLYLDREGIPTEDEHYENYKKLLEATAPHGAVIRTLDLGGDKVSDSLTAINELNPAMGLRAIRLCLARPDLFRPQLRGILRASVHGKARVMFPMISSYKEFMEAKAVLYEVARELEDEGVPYDRDLEVGVMIEVPSAVMVADELAEASDFFSIGTNDLIQYTLAIDRLNEHVSYLYEPFHPAVLRIISMVVEAGHKKNIPVHMCGAMAADPGLLPVLIGLDLDELSMPMGAVLRIKRVLRGLRKRDCIELVREISELKTSTEIKKRVKKEIEIRWAEAYAPEREAFADEDSSSLL